MPSSRLASAAFAALFLVPGQAEADNGVVSVTSENDLFGGTDRNYTNGIRIERVSPADRVFPLLREAADLVPGLDLDRISLRQGFALSHAIFTPADISRIDPDPDDRPYAAWLNLSGTVVASDADTQDALGKRELENPKTEERIQ